MATVIYYIYNNSLNQSEQATMKDCWLNSQISKGFTQKTIKCEKTVGHQLVHTYPWKQKVWIHGAGQ